MNLYHRYLSIGKNSLHEVWYHLQFQAFIGGLGTYQMRVNYYIGKSQMEGFY